jgi:hypothetical protein
MHVMNIRLFARLEARQQTTEHHPHNTYMHD